MPDTRFDEAIGHLMAPSFLHDGERESPDPAASMSNEEGEEVDLYDDARNRQQQEPEETLQQQQQKPPRLPRKILNRFASDVAVKEAPVRVPSADSASAHSGSAAAKKKNMSLNKGLTFRAPSPITLDRVVLQSSQEHTTPAPTNEQLNANASQASGASNSHASGNNSNTNSKSNSNSQTSNSNKSNTHKKTIHNYDGDDDDDEVLVLNVEYTLSESPKTIPHYVGNDNEEEEVELVDHAEQDASTATSNTGKKKKIAFDKVRRLLNRMKPKEVKALGKRGRLNASSKASTIWQWQQGLGVV